jgi:hypothetical protein
VKLKKILLFRMSPHDRIGRGRCKPSAVGGCNFNGCTWVCLFLETTSVDISLFDAAAAILLGSRPFILASCRRETRTPRRKPVRAEIAVRTLARCWFRESKLELPRKF